MESSKLISTEKSTVVIQINPQLTQNAVISDDRQQGRGSHHNTALEGCFKSQKALGTVQIMNGLMIFLFGVVRTNSDYNYHYSSFSLITYLGSLVYVSAGSLSVAAQNKLYRHLVKASRKINVLSTIIALVAIALMSVEIGSMFRDFNRIRNSHFARYDTEVLGMLLVFSILQFIISICISGFADKATYNLDSAVVNH